MKSGYKPSSRSRNINVNAFRFDIILLLDNKIPIIATLPIK
jgi:hypothetical protein